MATLKKSKKKAKSERAIEMARQVEEERSQAEAARLEKKKNWDFILAFEGIAMAVASFVFTYMGLVGFIALLFNGYVMYRTKDEKGREWKMAVVAVIIACIGILMAFFGWAVVFKYFGLTPTDL